MRIIFMGTPDFSVSALKAIVNAGHEVVAVYSQPPRRAGRGKQERPTAVHEAANVLSIPVFTPVSLKDKDAQNTFASHKADMAVVVAYGLLLPKAILDAPKYGCLNIHASLLPRWRGAAPIQRAIEAGDSQSGVCIMQMDEGLDTGDVLLEEAVSIAPETTGGMLHDQLSTLGARMIVEALENYHSLTPMVQSDEGATYAHKLKKEECAIDWHKSSSEIEHKIRAFSPHPSVYFNIGNERVKIMSASIELGGGKPGQVIDDTLGIACGDGVLRPIELQRQGKRAMACEEFLRGFNIPKHTILS